MSATPFGYTNRSAGIPAPAGLPWLGNLHQLPKGGFTQHLMRIAPDFDGIFSIDFAGYHAPFITSAELVAEVCDEKRFRKTIGPPLSILRPLAGDGLFTANGDEPNWALAHRVLIPAFSQRARRAYFDAMLDVARQLVDRWKAREGQPIDLSDDMTRLTLETITLCGFGVRFNTLQQDALHPFLAAMVRVLDEAMGRLTRLRFISRLRWSANQQFRDDIAFMHGMVDDLVRERRQASADSRAASRDLLGLMLDAEDPVTHQRLPDENIRFQVITFLIAGHETTSGLLSFALHLLLKHPQALARARAEAQAVWPPGHQPDYDELGRLVVIEQVLEETLRLWPTAPGFSVAPYQNETIGGGRYAIRKDERVTVLLPALHRDPKVWTDPQAFDIDRFAPDKRAQISTHAYKPFGSGSRACIGRQFAMMEAKIALALILSNFEHIEEADGPYSLKVRETLTLKPEGLRLRVRTRKA